MVLPYENYLAFIIHYFFSNCAQFYCHFHDLQKMIPPSSPFRHIIIPISAIIFFIPICILISRILFPTIISYPWKMPPENSRQRKREKQITVVLAGSFNPPHRGHLVMIRYLSER